MLIPSSNVNTTPESEIFFMTGFLRFFRRFPQINVGGDSAHFPPLEDAPVSLTSLAHKRVSCDNGTLFCHKYHISCMYSNFNTSLKLINYDDNHYVLCVFFFQMNDPFVQMNVVMELLVSEENECKMSG